MKIKRKNTPYMLFSMLVFWLVAFCFFIASLANAHTTTWNAAYEASPADSDSISAGAGKIRGLKEDVRERIAVDHYFDTAGTDADHGQHSKVTFQAPLGADPSNAANKGFLYTKDVSSVVELFFEDESGNVIQLSSGGLLYSGDGLGHGTTIDFDIGGTVQLGISDGILAPETDNDIDLGDATHAFKNAYLEGKLYGTASNYLDIVMTQTGANDDKILRLCGGSAATNSAGAYISLFGDDHAVNPGNMILYAGVSGNILVAGDLLPASDSTYDVGSQASHWSVIYSDYARLDYASAAAPTYAFDGDGDTGFYRSADNEVGFSAGGTQYLTFSSDGLTPRTGGAGSVGTLTDYFNLISGNSILAGDGNASTPGFRFRTDNDNGMYLSAANTLAFSCGGTGQVVIADGVLRPVSDDDIDLGTTSSQFKNAYFDGVLYTDGFFTEDGSAAAPSISFSGDTDTGFYLVGAGSVGYASGGVGQVRFNDGAILPVTDDDVDLGSGTYKFKDGFFDGVLYVDARIQSATASQFDIYNSTSDGSDNRLTRIGGGGDVSASRGAYIVLYGNENAANPGDLVFYAGETGDIYASGHFVPVTNATFNLGSATYTFATTYSDQFYAGVGTAAAPDFTFNGDSNTGMYRNAANQVGFSCSGSLAMALTATGPVFTSAIKASSGDPTGTEGMLTINTSDSAIKIYADGAWRTLATW